jgi:hypothetical protein
MKYVLKLEEAIQFIACIYILYLLESNWWLYLLVLTAPDIGMIGYMGGNKTGAILYNIIHHKGLAILLVGIGIVFGNDVSLLTGIILFGHAAMDRMFGFGLKYYRGFRFTHLGDFKS